MSKGEPGKLHVLDETSRLWLPLKLDQVKYLSRHNHLCPCHVLAGAGYIVDLSGCALVVKLAWPFQRLEDVRYIVRDRSHRADIGEAEHASVPETHTY